MNFKRSKAVTALLVAPGFIMFFILSTGVLAGTLPENGPSKITDISGHEVQFTAPGRSLTILLFFNPRNFTHKALAAFTQVLTDRHKDKGVFTLGIIPSTDDIESLKDVVRFPLIHDSRGGLHKQYGFENCCGGLVLLEGNGAVFFSQTLLNPETLRQLTEKQVLGEIHYEQSAEKTQQLFSTGGRIPELTLRHPASGRSASLRQLAGKKTLISFFSSMCPSCRSGARIKNLKHIRERFQGQEQAPEIIVVFFTPADDDDVKQMAASLEIPFDIYITGNFLTPDEQYITDSDARLDPFSVIISPEGSVLYAETAATPEETVMEEILLSLPSSDKGE